MYESLNRHYLFSSFFIYRSWLTFLLLWDSEEGYNFSLLSDWNLVTISVELMTYSVFFVTEKNMFTCVYYMLLIILKSVLSPYFGQIRYHMVQNWAIVDQPLIWIYLILWTETSQYHMKKQRNTLLKINPNRRSLLFDYL